ncbi:MAG: AraC family transcriptional regulator [Paenibacillaceae bacterium]|nr:AraC family transcriptional regulator [Paenibacillaceae bacterium]
MRCLELPIPPLPQLITVGHAWHKPDFCHFRRNFPVYDVLFVKKGAFNMTEEDTEYELRDDCVLVLEPGRTHWGHRRHGVATEVYWVHFAHEAPSRVLMHEEIGWSLVQTRGTDKDELPSTQRMYLPKFGKLDMAGVYPFLDQMHELHSRMLLENSLQMQVLLGQLLPQLQKAAYFRPTSSSAKLSGQIVDYLHVRLPQPFDAGHMAGQFHFHFDYLARCLKKHTGLSPLQYYRRIQVEKAKSLLEHTSDTIQEVGEQVGVANYNYFIRLFRGATGVSPGVYRNARRGDLGE